MYHWPRSLKLVHVRNVRGRQSKLQQFSGHGHMDATYLCVQRLAACSLALGTMIITYLILEVGCTQLSKSDVPKSFIACNLAIAYA